jgi:hypothetical protein
MKKKKKQKKKEEARRGRRQERIRTDRGRWVEKECPAPEKGRGATAQCSPILFFLLFTAFLHFSHLHLVQAIAEAMATKTSWRVIRFDNMFISRKIPEIHPSLADFVKPLMACRLTVLDLRFPTNPNKQTKRKKEKKENKKKRKEQKPASKIASKQAKTRACRRGFRLS